MGHGISKQQTPEVLGGSGEIFGWNDQRESRKQSASGDSLGRQKDPLDRPGFRVTLAFGRDIVKSHKDLCQARYYGVISVSKLRGQRQGCLIYGDQLATTCERKKRQSIGTR